MVVGVFVSIYTVTKIEVAMKSSLPRFLTHLVSLLHIWFEMLTYSRTEFEFEVENGIKSLIDLGKSQVTIIIIYK